MCGQNTLKRLSKNRGPLLYSEQELLAQAHLAAMEEARREREEEAKSYMIKLEKIIQYQPNDFAD
jgi:DNA-binding protein YbaB